MNHKIKSIIKYTIAIAWSIINLTPLFVVIFGSFKTTNEIYMGPFVPPKALDWSNYNKAIMQSGVLKGILNSFCYGLVSVIIILVVALMAGHVLARYKGKLINIIYIFFILGVLVPVQATFIPLVETVGKLRMQGNIITMIVIYVTFNLPISILLTTGYMKSIPKEIDEAAIIDGCGSFRIFTTITAPLSVPAAATAGILAFNNIYNDLIFAMLFISNSERRTITQVINGFSTQYSSDMGATFAAVVVAITPMIIVFMCFQEKVIAGMATGAVKG
jgi:raffinose/stachyose/melibiose transport system permease protein